MQHRNSKHAVSKEGVLEYQPGDCVLPYLHGFLSADEGLVRQGHIVMNHFKIVDMQIRAMKDQCAL